MKSKELIEIQPVYFVQFMASALNSIIMTSPKDGETINFIDPVFAADLAVKYAWECSKAYAKAKDHMKGVDDD
jgi:hypothetical protein